ncbi:Uncharacterized protein APZ42_005234, partial [Daphnia magna]
TKEKTVYFN